jgi:hypothetical protein
VRARDGVASPKDLPLGGPVVGYRPSLDCFAEIDKVPLM